MLALLAMMTFALHSPAFPDNGAIPRAHAHSQEDCGGQNVSPPVKWSGAPSNTHSFVLTVIDHDAPVPGGFVHWIAYDIPGASMGIETGKQPPHEAMNSFGSVGYGGPCPPQGDQAHHYMFTLYAIDVPSLKVQAKPTLRQVLNAMQGHVLGQTELIGTYQRK